MKAIDELRETADECTTMAGVENKFETVWITKKAFMNMLDEIERELEEEYAPLPKDANGETIHIGDRVENNERVVRITLTDGSWEPLVYIDKAPCVLEEHFCCEVSHYHEPTVEDVLREFAKSIAETLGGDEFLLRDDDEMYAEFAERLRLREESE